MRVEVELRKLQQQRPELGRLVPAVAPYYQGPAGAEYHLSGQGWVGGVGGGGHEGHGVVGGHAHKGGLVQWDEEAAVGE